MPRAPSKQSKLARIVARLGEHYGRVDGPLANTAFGLILWELVAYLAPDAKRAAAYRTLERDVGVTPAAIMNATPAKLQAVTALGGSVAIVERAQRMHDGAAIVIDDFGGSLESVLSLPLPAARRALRRFHGVAEPGADKILLLRRAHRVFPLESNGLRVLLRIGYGVDDTNYTRAYRSAVEAVRPEVADEFDWLIDAYLLLRHHGQETCKTGAPRCERCVVREDCAHARRRAVTL